MRLLRDVGACARETVDADIRRGLFDDGLGRRELRR